jgi:hypothetical protein
MPKHIDQQIAAVAPASELSRPADQDTLLTEAEVSEMLGNIPRSTLRAWRARGFGLRFIRGTASPSCTSLTGQTRNGQLERPSMTWDSGERDFRQ